MIAFWSGPGGALMCADEIEGVTQDLSQTPVTEYSDPTSTMEYYGGRYMVGETIMRSAAEVIAQALGGYYVENP